jgi:hypothetical protein
MVIRVEIETWVISKGGTKMRDGKGWVSGGRGMGAAGFVTLMCVRVNFHCCSGGCLCQGFRGLWGVYSWYSRLVSG